MSEQTFRIGVVGAGTMGGGIAQKLAMEGFPVVLCDLGEPQLEAGMAKIKALLDEGIERRALTPQAKEAALGNLHPTAAMSDLSGCGMVIEAVFEDLKVKRDLFASLEGVCAPSTILATNTSSFLVADIAKGMSHPERVIGLHFFFHPVKNRLVEVIGAPASDPGMVKRAWDLMAATGKTPIATKDSPGFCVNRFFVPWLNEAVRLLDEGVASLPTIEAVSKEAFRIGMGPFALMNATGVPIARHAAAGLAENLGDFYAPAPGLEAQAKSGRPWDLSGEPDGKGAEAAARRLFSAAWAVCGQLLDEDVATLEDTDRGAKIGLRWAMGPFEWMNRKGVAQAVAEVERFCLASRGLSVASSLKSKAAQGTPWAFRLVDLKREDGVAHIVINRPEAMNALNGEVLAQLEAAFDEALADDKVKGIVLRGAGKAFVAGADVRFFIKAIEAGKIPEIVSFTRGAQALYAKIASSNKPVTAVLHGLALGGGAELALTAHRVLASPKGSIGFPETGIGIYPALGGTFRTARRAGPELARYLVLTGRVVSAAEALDMGLVDEVIGPLELEARLREIASSPAPKPSGPRKEFAALKAAFDGNPPAILKDGFSPGSPEAASALKAVKAKAPLATSCAAELISQNLELQDGEAYANELARIESVFSTEDALTGLKSVGRERPVFKGK